LDRITRFMLEADKLKAIDRTGWVIRKVKKPEHVGDHSFSTALSSYIIARKLGLDANRCLIMALTHDLNEVNTGDIATRPTERQQKVDNKTKLKLENKNMIKILSNLDKSSYDHLRHLWLELQEGKTDEAQLVNGLDRLDYILQLVPYHRQIKNDSQVYEFFITAKRHITNPELKYIYEKIRKQIRKERSKPTSKRA